MRTARALIAPAALVTGLVVAGCSGAGPQEVAGNATPAGQLGSAPPSAASRTANAPGPSPATSTPAAPTPAATPAPATTPPEPAPASTNPRAPTPRRLVVYTCLGQPVSAPSSLVLACADAGIRLRHLQWSSWGEPKARATGDLIENNCTPSCAQGSDVQYPASVTVSGVSGKQYTFMHVNVPQAPGGPYDYTFTTRGPS